MTRNSESADFRAEEVLVRHRLSENRWVPMRPPLLGSGIAPSAEINLAFPIKPPAYPAMESYAPMSELVGAVWRDVDVDEYVDHPPLEQLVNDTELVNRCRWWRGTVRHANQDALTYRGRTWTVVQLMWERAWGPVDGRQWMASPTVRGWGDKPMVARPTCCHYTQRFVCCNARHYRLQPRGAGTDQKLISDRDHLAILAQALEGRTPREIAHELELPLRPVQRELTQLRRDRPGIARARRARLEHAKEDTN